jgi:GTP-binding protein
MSFVAAIAGRPNVGKSTLFNRLAGKKIAIVDDRPGVTRDRREGEANLAGLAFTIVDTAGLDDPAAIASLDPAIRRQTEAALAEADVVLFVVDAREGVTASDKEIANHLRRSGKPVVLLANKCEGRAGLGGLGEAHALGFGEPVAISAEHGEGFSDLLDVLRPFAGEDPGDETEESEDAAPDRPVQIAIVGRPNAGKSTLMNRLLGEERMVVSPVAGTTRDAIGVEWEWEGRKIKLFDTAGMRKKARIDDRIEKMSVADSLRAIRFADVVILLLEPDAALEKQDLSIADLVEREGRALVFAVSKWDLVESGQKRLAELKRDVTELLPQVKGAPFVALSGLTGAGLGRLMPAVFEAYDIWNKRVATADLNRWLGAALERHPPKAVSGRRIKLRYMTQVKARPPTFAIFGNQLDQLDEAYIRYLTNGLREVFKLPGVPIRILKRGSKNPFDQE